MKKSIMLALIFALLPAAYATVSVETFTCSGQSGTIVVENGAAFSCQASLKNEDTQNSAGIGSVSLLVSSSWAEQTSYTGTGFSTTISAGASTTATFSGIKAVAPGPTNKFQSMQIDNSADTFVANTNVNVIAIKSLSVTPTVSSLAQNNEFDVSAALIAGGDLSSVALEWSGSGGCSLTAGHTASKSIGALVHNTEATRSWRVLQGSADCVNTITASGTSSSVTTTKSKSATVSVVGGGSSGTTTTSSGGGGGGGGAVANKTAETKTIKDISPALPANIELTKTAVKSILIEVLNEVKNVLVSVEEVASPDVPAPPQGVYKYLDISVNISESNIKSASIIFSVDTAWLSGKDKNSVRLNRYASRWQQLPTIILEANATAVKYRATTPGFSVFAITASSAAAASTAETAQPAVAICGNNAREGEEECDGTDIGGQACTTKDFAGGTLGCSDGCRFDTSRCTQQQQAGQAPTPTESRPGGTGYDLYVVVLALMVVAVLGYWHYHHSPQKKVSSFVEMLLSLRVLSQAFCQKAWKHLEKLRFSRGTKALSLERK